MYRLGEDHFAFLRGEEAEDDMINVDLWVEPEPENEEYPTVEIDEVERKIFVLQSVKKYDVAYIEQNDSDQWKVASM